MALMQKFIYLLRRADTKEFAADLNYTDIDYTPDYSDAQTFESESAATAALADSIMNIEAEITDFEIVELAIITTNVMSLPLTNDMRFDYMSGSARHSKRALRKSMQQNQDTKYCVSYRNYEFSPEGPSQFNLDAIYKSRGKIKLNITVSGKHYNKRPSYWGKKLVTGTIFIHGYVSGKKVVESWTKRDMIKKLVRKRIGVNDASNKKGIKRKV